MRSFRRGTNGVRAVYLLYADEEYFVEGCMNRAPQFPHLLLLEERESRVARNLRQVTLELVTALTALLVICCPRSKSEKSNLCLRHSQVR